MMVDKEIRCECHKKLAELHEDKLEIVCPRCKHFNTLNLSKTYQSHKLLALENKDVV